MRGIEIDANTYSYSEGVLVQDASKLLFVSGWRGRTLDVLGRAGLGPANLVKVTVFLSDRRFREENARIRQEVLGDHTPALTVIITGIYDEAWLLEIEAIACA